MHRGLALQTGVQLAGDVYSGAGGISAGDPRGGRGQGCEVAWDQHLPCAIYRKSGTCTGHAQLAADTTDTAVLRNQTHVEGEVRLKWLQKVLVLFRLKNKVYSCVFKSQCPPLNIAAQKAVK